MKIFENFRVRWELFFFVYMVYCEFGRKVIFRFGGEGFGLREWCLAWNCDVIGYIVREMRIYRGDSTGLGEYFG